MRIVVGVLATSLLLLLSGSASAQAVAAPPALRPAIQRLLIDNRGEDAAIVLLARPSEKTPFYQANKLRPGAQLVVDVPNLPSVQVGVLRRDEVRRLVRALSGDNKKDGDKKDGPHITLGLGGDRHGNQAKGGNEGGSRQGKESPTPVHDDRNDEPGERPPPREDRNGEDYGRDRSHDNGDYNAGSYHVLLGNMLGSVSREDKNAPPQLGPPPGARAVIDADDGSGTRVVDKVRITPTVADAAGVEDDPAPAGANPPVVVNTPPPPPVSSTPPPKSAEPCYCGPDMTVPYVQVLARARDRLAALPDSEKGAWDGAWFLFHNGSSVDERVRSVPLPNQGATVGNASPALLCPSGRCARLSQTGGPTMSLFGFCLAEHIGNDIMYGFVATMLDVPGPIQEFGGQWAEYNAYHHWDPPQSRAAYAIGASIASLEEINFTEQTVGSKFRAATYTRVHPESVAENGVVSKARANATPPVEFFNAVAFIQQMYPELAACPHCPVDGQWQPTLWRDWSHSAWQLDDGSKVYPPDYDPEATGD